MSENGGRKLFGTDGIRGVANVVSHDGGGGALARPRRGSRLPQEGSHRHKIVIGKDTRLSGYMLETAMASGICSMGVDVLLVGPMPTPGIAFLTRSHARRRGRGDLCIAQPVPGQRHQVLRRQRTSSFPTRSSSRSSSLMRDNSIDHAPADGHRDRQGVSRRRRPRALQRLRQGRVPSRSARSMECASSSTARTAPRTGSRRRFLRSSAPRSTAMGVRSRRPEHQPRLRRAPPGKARDGRRSSNGLSPRRRARRRRRPSDLRRRDRRASSTATRCSTIAAARSARDRGRSRRRRVVATVMSNLGLELAMRGARRSRRAYARRRSLRGRGDAARRLQPRRRAIGSHGLPRPHHDRRRPHHGARVLAVMVEHGRPLSELAQGHEADPAGAAQRAVTREALDRRSAELCSSRSARRNRALQRRGRVVVRYSGTETLARVMVEGDDGEVDPPARRGHHQRVRAGSRGSLTEHPPDLPRSRP